MGNLSHYAGSSSGPHPNNPGSPGDTTNDHAGAADGYASEDFVPGSSSSRERKKGSAFSFSPFLILNLSIVLLFFRCLILKFFILGMCVCVLILT